MSAPTPETVKSAAMAIQDASLALHPTACERFARAALTAAYPLMAAQSRAEALREAADAFGAINSLSGAPDWLRARATAIETSSPEETK